MHRIQTSSPNSEALINGEYQNQNMISIKPQCCICYEKFSLLMDIKVIDIISSRPTVGVYHVISSIKLIIFSSYFHLPFLHVSLPSFHCTYDFNDTVTVTHHIFLFCYAL